MQPDDLDLQALNQRVQLDDEWRLLGQAHLAVRAREMVASEHEEQLNARELHARCTDARINARENASARREQASRKYLASAITLWVLAWIAWVWLILAATDLQRAG